MAYVDVADESLRKTDVGIPEPQWPRGVDLAYESRRGRRRLYPMTIAYSLLCLTLMVWALWHAPLQAALGIPLGVLGWTYLEYLAHRYILHGVFPDGKSPWRHFLHQRFDGLHWFHHLHPWNGVHINGTVKDTGLFVALFVAMALWTGSAFWVGWIGALVQSYVFEEWVHHSVHFYRFKNSYFQYIRRHHVYHHSPRGGKLAYGLSNGLWDVICGTRIPEADRKLLYGRGRSTAPPPQERGRAA